MNYEINVLEPARHEQAPGGGSRYVYADIMQNGRKVGEVEGNISFEPTGEPRSTVDVFQGMRAITVYKAVAFRGEYVSGSSTESYNTLQAALTAAEQQQVYKKSPYHEQPTQRAQVIGEYSYGFGTTRQDIDYKVRGGDTASVAYATAQRDIEKVAQQIFGREVIAMPIAKEFQKDGSPWTWAIFKGPRGGYFPEGGANSVIAVYKPGFLQFTEYGHQVRA